MTGLIDIRRRIDGASWMIAGCFAFSLSGASAKFLGTKLPPVELAFLRAGFGLLIVIVAWRAIAELRVLKDPAWHAARGILGVTALFCILVAFTHLPIALVSVVLAGRTFLLIALAAVLCKERPGPIVWAAACLGVSGVVIALWPQLNSAFADGFTPTATTVGAASALAAALTSSGSQLAVRRLTDTNSPSVIVIVFGIFAFTVLSVPAAWTWTAPGPGDWGILIALGVFGVCSQWCSARCYSRIGASRAAPIDLAQIPVGACVGWLLFGEIPDIWTFAGAVLIVTAALWVTAADAK